jgi:hypothetical protein
VLDFLLTQGTSTSAKQYSVLVIHVFSPFVIGLVAQAHAPRKSVCSVALRRSRKRLTAELTHMLISIRRRRAGA